MSALADLDGVMCKEIDRYTLLNNSLNISFDFAYSTSTPSVPKYQSASFSVREMR